MRLGKEDFRTLLNEPMLQWVDVDGGAARSIGRGGQWLDVRLPSEFETLSIRRCDQHPAVFHAPQAQDARYRDVPYVVCCDTGRRSSAAAYILSERGFDAYVLKGGIAATDLAEALIGNYRPHLSARVPARARAGQPPPRPTLRGRESSASSSASRTIVSRTRSAAAPPAVSHCSKSPADSGRET